MDNKLSELSKPVGFVSKQAQALLKSGDTASVRPFFDVQGSSPLYSQEYVSALLAELEFEKQNNSGVAGMVEDYETKLEAKDKRIAELSRLLAHNIERAEKAEKRLATPVRLLGEMLLHDWEHRVERQAAFEHRKIAWDARLAEDKKAIQAAGFTFTVEGDSE